MTGPIDRLRRRDPAAGLPPQPDAEAEAGLRLLLAESRIAPAPAAARVRERRPLAPALVTGFVALLLVVLTVAILGTVRPRTDEAAPAPTPAPTGAATIAPPYVFERCHPADVAPFLCGTYTSVSGAPSVTGSTGGPKQDPLSISFTRYHGVLLLEARSSDGCFAAAVPVRYDGRRLVGVGAPVLGQGSPCTRTPAPREPDTTTWAYRFLTGPLAVNAASGGLAFNLGSTLVIFDYEGPAAIGEPQPPRTETSCVPAHVAPFSCGRFRSVRGTGALGFLAAHPFTFQVSRGNGELVGGLHGDCNGLGVVLQPDDHTVFAMPGLSTLMLCEGDRGARDDAVRRFFDGDLTVRTTAEAIVLTRGDSSATFRRD